ncbi:DUF6232 family protein [Kitasatospora sp. NPDC057512]|uniref:DUF6232 family protein n=1 Tax=Kitasatospora sp. NPDC057512 TaxID=3346154 RepID=UPI0036A6E162
MHNRVLWVGGDAYPLHQLASARQVIWPPPSHSGEVLRSLRQFLWLVLVVVVLAYVCVKSGNGIVSEGVPLLAMVAGLVLIVRRLLPRLRQAPLYGLMLETSSSSTTAVVSHDSRQIAELIQLIMTAIDNPRADFLVRVESVHIGDRITQHGNHNTGKQVRR